MDTKIPSDVEKLSVKFRKGLYKYVNSNNKNKLSDKQKKALNVALKVFVYNCIISSASSGNFCISLSKNTYSKASIRNGVSVKDKVSYTYTKQTLQYFEYLKYITVDKGYVKEWNARKVKGKYNISDTSAFETVPTIVQLTHNFRGICLDVNVSKETFLQINNLILRNSDKQDITFDIDLKRKGEVTMLEDYNIRALETEVTKFGKEGKYLVQLRKIYNESFDKGGRLYDLCIQSMPKSERKHLIIDNEPVVLLDYKSFETSIAYTLADADMNGDPYYIDFEGYDAKVVRDVCKLIMTRIYNVSDEKTLNHLVNEHIRENYDLEKLVREGKIPEKRIPVGLFTEILKDKHDHIKDFFWNTGSYNLQYVGSQIMDYVIERVMQNHTNTVIPVFDEVICGVSIKDEVLQYMYDAYEVVLECKDNCNVEEE